MPQQQASNLKEESPPSDSRSYRVHKSNTRAISVIFSILCGFFDKFFLSKITSGYKRSEVTDEKVIEDFKRFDVPAKPDLKGHPAYEKAISIANRLIFGDFKWSPVHFADTRSYDWNLASSAEEPLTSDKALCDRIKEAHSRGELPTARCNKANTFNTAYIKFRQYVHQIKSGMIHIGTKFPATAHARSHIVSVDKPDKVRMVFGMPWLSLMIEVMFFWPLFAYLRKGLSPILWGYETMTGGMYRLHKHLRPVMTFIMVDWKQFDKRLPYFLARRFFSAVHERIDFTQYEATTHYPDGKPTDPARLERLFKWMVNYYQFHPTKLPDGSIWTRRYAGEASGNLITQLIDSWVNLVVILTCLFVLDSRFNFEDEEDIIKVLGDDSATFIRGVIPNLDEFRKRFAATAEDMFGFILNEDKSVFSYSPSDIDVLGYANDAGYPKPDIEKLIAQFLMPERRVDPGRIKARALGMAYASCGMDENFYQACKAVYDRFIDADLNFAGSEYLLYLRTQGLTVPAEFPSIEELRSRLLDSKPPDLTVGYWPDFFLRRI